MATVDVTELIERARSASDIRDNFVTQTEWLRWANTEHKWLQGFVARAGYVLFENSENITADGSISYNIDEPLVILGVYEVLSSGTYRRLRHADVMDGPPLRDVGVYGPADTFRVSQNTNDQVTVSFYPRPQTGNYVVRNIELPKTLVLGTPGVGEDDSVYYPLGWEERIVLGMARRALAKEGSSTSELSRQIRECELEIERAAWDRVMGGHQGVRNVDRVERGWTEDHRADPRLWVWV